MFFGIQISLAHLCCKTRCDLMRAGQGLSLANADPKV